MLCRLWSLLLPPSSAAFVCTGAWERMTSVQVQVCCLQLIWKVHEKSCWPEIFVVCLEWFTLVMRETTVLRWHAASLCSGEWLWMAKFYTFYNASFQGVHAALVGNEEYFCRSTSWVLTCEAFTTNDSNPDALSKSHGHCDLWNPLWQWLSTFLMLWHFLQFHMV